MRHRCCAAPSVDLTRVRLTLARDAVDGWPVRWVGTLPETGVPSKTFEDAMSFIQFGLAGSASLDKEGGGEARELWPDRAAHRRFLPREPADGGYAQCTR